MLERLTDALTGRRLGGALFVLCGLIVAALVLSRDDGGSDRPAKKSQPVRIVSLPQLGLAFAHPRTWKRTVSGRVIRLRSPDQGTVLTFSSPLAGSHTQPVKRALKAALRKRFAPTRVVRDGPGRLGSRKVTTFELRGLRRGSIRALALVGSSAHRTYAITVLTPARPSARELAQAQQILMTVRFSKPLPAPR